MTGASTNRLGASFSKCSFEKIQIESVPYFPGRWTFRCVLWGGMSKTRNRDRRRTITVPVTTMEEIPVLTDAERDELLASLKESEARAKAGEAIDYDPKSFRDRLLAIYRGTDPPIDPWHSVCALTEVAQRQMDQFAAYLRDYSEDFAIEQIERLNSVLHVNIAETPLRWSYFPLTGPSYRAYLFRVGRRTQYWIVYTVDEDGRTVDVLSFCNAARDPESIEP
jgi:hypothetical protein